MEKFFEKIVFKNIYNHLKNNKLIYPYQSGFIPGHSTIHQLVEIYDTICKAFENQNYYCMTFCDISKAFDRVWHKGLLHKLHHYGLTGNILKWLKSYLSDRRQCVQYNNCSSYILKVTAGVPQGSVLGPLLFLIYVNDMADKLQCFTRLFADDTSIGTSSNSINHIQNISNEDLAKLIEWASDWLVNFNPSKTDIVLFSNRTLIINTDFKFGDVNIEPTNTHKHLGLTFCNDGKWSTHIDQILQKAAKQLGLLKNVKYLISRQSLQILYTIFIRPVMEYASEVWDNCSEGHSDRLEKLQLEAARIITGLPSYTSKEALYFETGLETLKSRRKVKRLCLLYKIINEQAPEYLQHLLPPSRADSNPYLLRSNNNITIPPARLDIYLKSFFPNTIREWNSLDINVRNSINLSTFKRKIKTPINQAPFYFREGDRKLNILHTKLRYRCSGLNSDLSRVNLVESNNCSCGTAPEDAGHYFLHCHKYDLLRQQLFSNLMTLTNNINLKTILFGDESLTSNCNNKIFKFVQDFIKRSKRFE